MAVFITGGHGHIASWTAYFLARQGNQVILYDTNPVIPDCLKEVSDNITFIKGDSGWIVFDPLTTRETSAAALELVTEHLGDRPVRAVVYSHTHADHWGGVKGVVTAEEVASGKVQVIAPEGFMEHAVAENLLAGKAVSPKA